MRWPFTSALMVLMECDSSSLHSLEDSAVVWYLYLLPTTGSIIKE